jgi:hypothetical protein
LRWSSTEECSCKDASCAAAKISQVEPKIIFSQLKESKPQEKKIVSVFYF